MKISGPAVSGPSDAHNDRVADQVRRLFGPGVCVAATDPRRAQPPLHPDEHGAMAAMAAPRRRSYAAGRTAARRAIAETGVSPAPVMMAPDRSPIWPPDVTGSISHCETSCIAVAALRSEVRSLGVDVEEDGPLSPDVVAAVCSVRERQWLGKFPPDQAGRFAKLIFSAKECAYKCQYPVSRQFIGFDAVEIDLSPDTNSFSAHFKLEVRGFDATRPLTGRYSNHYGLVFTAMTIPKRL